MLDPFVVLGGAQKSCFVRIRIECRVDDVICGFLTSKKDNDD